MKLNLNDIVTNENQPRKYFDEEKLKELASSIQSDGLQEPILVRPINNGKYEIVQGERRYRAHKLAGLTEIEVKVKQLDNEEAFHLAVIENIQREQLTPIEEAEAFQKYVEMGYTQSEIAKKVSKSRDYVINRLQLLELIPEIQDMIAEKKITGSHIKPLMRMKNQIARLMGTRGAFETLQMKFFAEHRKKEKVTVKELNDWIDRLREYFLVCIVGTFNGHGDKRAGSSKVAEVEFERKLKDICMLYDLHIKNVKREDIHFMLERVLNAKPSNVKRSEIYKTYEDLEENIFDSVKSVTDVWVSRGMNKKQLKEQSLEEITESIKSNKKILEDYAKSKGCTFDDLVEDLEFILISP